MSEKTTYLTWPKEIFKLYFAISSNDFRDSKENSKLQRNTTKLVRVYWFEILHRLTKKNGDDRE